MVDFFYFCFIIRSVLTAFIFSSIPPRVSFPFPYLGQALLPDLQDSDSASLCLNSHFSSVTVWDSHFPIFFHLHSKPVLLSFVIPLKIHSQRKVHLQNLKVSVSCLSLPHFVSFLMFVFELDFELFGGRAGF